MSKMCVLQIRHNLFTVNTSIILSKTVDRMAATPVAFSDMHGAIKQVSMQTHEELIHLHYFYPFTQIKHPMADTKIQKHS